MLMSKMLPNVLLEEEASSAHRISSVKNLSCQLTAIESAVNRQEGK